MKIVGIQKNSVLKVCLLIGLTFQSSFIKGYEKDATPFMQYSISMPEPSNHLFHVTLFCGGLKEDTIDFKMPRQDITRSWNIRLR